MARNMETIVTALIGGFVMQNAQLQSMVEALQEKCIQLETDLKTAQYKGPTAVPTNEKQVQWPIPQQPDLPFAPE